MKLSVFICSLFTLIKADYTDVQKSIESLTMMQNVLQNNALFVRKEDKNVGSPNNKTMASTISKETLSGEMGMITTVAGNGIICCNRYYYNLQATSAKLAPYGIAIDTSGNMYIGGINGIYTVAKSTGMITALSINGYFTTYAGVALDALGNIYAVDNSYNAVIMITKATNIITIVAGNGTSGYNGDNRLASSAMLAYPWGVAVDSSGNIYICDSRNQRVRVVYKSTSMISTVAGNGIIDYNGDNIQATSASLQYPYGIAVDVVGNIYIAHVSRIRMVTKSTGIITTVAGGGKYGSYNEGNSMATSVYLNFPTGVAVDASGNIFLVDFSSSKVLMVTKSTGIITTIAGNGTRGYNGDNRPAASAMLAYVWGLAVDTSGANVYIADTYNYRVRMVTIKATSATPTLPPTVSSSVNPTAASTSSINPSTTSVIPSFIPSTIPTSATVLFTPTTTPTSPFPPTIAIVSLLKATNSISGLTSVQANSESFSSALLATIASILGVQASAISIGNMIVMSTSILEALTVLQETISEKIGAKQDSRALLAGVTVTYIVSVTTALPVNAVITILHTAVSSGEFSSSLSNNSGLGNLGVQGVFVDAYPTSSDTPTTSPVSTSSGTGGSALSRIFSPMVLGAIVGAIAGVLFFMLSLLIWYFCGCRKSIEPTPLSRTGNTRTGNPPAGNPFTDIPTARTYPHLSYPLTRNDSDLLHL